MVNFHVDLLHFHVHRKYSESNIYKWLRINTLDRLSSTFGVASAPITSPTEEVWRERDEAVGAIKAYLTDTPSTSFYFILRRRTKMH